MPRTVPSDSQLADLITPEMMQALTGYGQGDLTAGTALVAIIKAIPLQRFLALAQSYGMLPKPEPVAMWPSQDVLAGLAEHMDRLDRLTLAMTDQGRRHDERIRDLERRFEGGV